MMRKENAVFQVEVREQKRAPECAMEHTVDVPVPQIAETGRLKEVNQLITRDRISDCVDDQMDVVVPKIRERNVEVAKSWASAVIHATGTGRRVVAWPSTRRSKCFEFLKHFWRPMPSELQAVAVSSVSRRLRTRSRHRGIW